MTLESQSNNDNFSLNNSIQMEGTSVLEDLFLIGYTKSKKIRVYQDDKYTLDVVFRTLTPTEWRDIFEICGKYSTFGSQNITEKLEILARSICMINDMPLTLNIKDKEYFKTKYGREPDPLDMSRFILIEKINSLPLVELIYEEFRKFDDEIKSNFEDIKKKLNNQ